MRTTNQSNQSNNTTPQRLNNQQSDELAHLVEDALIKAIRVVKDAESTDTKKAGKDWIGTRKEFVR